MLRVIAIRLARSAGRPAAVSRLTPARISPATAHQVAHFASERDPNAGQGNLDDFFAGHAGTSYRQSSKVVHSETGSSKALSSSPRSTTSSSVPSSSSSKKDDDERFPTQSTSSSNDSGMSYRDMMDRDNSSGTSRPTKTLASTTSSDDLVTDLNEFFGTAIANLDSSPKRETSISTEHFSSAPQLPSNAPWPIASYSMPQESGVAMIRRFLGEHKFLSTGDIWKMGTEGMKPVIQPSHFVQPDGKIRMKRVATMREGRRAWIPPKEPSFPEHPFRSVRFLKGTILSSLEDQEIVHKSTIHVPLETEQEHLDAVRKAEQINRKAERKAVRLREPPPMMRAPATTKEIWGWKLGPRKTVEWRTDEEGMMKAVDVYPEPTEDSDPVVGPIIPVPDVKWEHAERMEYQFHRTKLMEARATAERQLIRRTKYREDRDKERKEREADKKSGRWAEIQKERRRLEALADIEYYAKQTGQDVSQWIEELGSGPLDESPRYRPKHLARGGAIPRSGRGADRKPVGFPVN